MKQMRLVYGLMVILLWVGLVACQQEPEAAPTAVAATAVAPTAAPTEETVVAAEATIVATEEAVVVVEETAVTDSAPVDQLPLIDSFENNALASGTAGLAPVGFLTWSDGSPVSIAAVTLDAGSELARPEQSGANTVLQLNTDVGAGGWAGYSHAFANETLDGWVGQDWSPYAGVSLWLYGNNNGGTIFLDILDNRAPDSTTDDAERWTYDIVDDFSGWQYVEIPFEAFRRKDIGNGAPNDGLTYEDIHGYAVGVFGSVDVGPEPVYVDDVALYGVAPVRPVEVSLLETEYLPREGGRAVVRLKLNKAADEPVTVQVAVVQGTAVAGQDFVLASDVVTFASGSTAESVTIEVLDDAVVEGTERALIVLSQPTGAVLNPRSRAVMTIRDDETAVANVIDPFNALPPFALSPGTSMAVVTVAADDPLALPEQAEYESVLQVSHGDTAVLTRTYGTAQDWSAYEGLRLWYFGNGSGEPVRVTLLDNRSTSTAVTDPAEWQLIWSDEFEGEAGASPNLGIWQPEIGDGLLNGIPGWGNGELEYYTADPQNVALDGAGNLVITAVAEDTATTDLSCWYGPCAYTSARLITWDSAEFAYGRVEARLKLPLGQGMWPAFWMLGTNLDEVGWPQSGEIDIMENIGREPSTYHGTLHGPGYSGGQSIGAGYDLPEGTVADDFHTVAIEWQPDLIRWFVDDQLFFTMTPDDIPAGSEWVYNHPFFIILNLAVGGNWPGLPDETTTFPQTMMVDYVRVYGAADSAERFEASFVDDFTGWQQISLPFASFTRSAVQSDGAPDDGLTLTEMWGYVWELPPNETGVTYVDGLQFE